MSYFKFLREVVYYVLTSYCICFLTDKAYCDSENIFEFAPSFNRTYLGSQNFSGIPSKYTCRNLFLDDRIKSPFIEKHSVIKIKTDSPKHFPIFFSAYVLKKTFYDYPFAIKDQAPLFVKEYDFYSEKFKYKMKIKAAIYIYGPVSINGLTLGGFYYIFEDLEDTRRAFSEDIGYVEIEEGLLVSAKYKGIEMLINHNVFGVPYCDVGIKFW